MSNYKEILRIEIKHDYFENNPKDLVEIKPDSATEAIFREIELNFTQEANLYKLLVPESIDAEEISSKIPDTQLKFEWNSKDPKFEQFTDVDLFLKEICSFSLDDLLKENLETPPHHVIHFKERLIAWKYLIIGRGEDPFENITLKLKGDKAELFGEPSEEVLQNGAEAQTFSSGYVFHQEGNESVKLTLEYTANGKVNEIPLPLPTPNQLVNKKGKFHAPIYVYL